MNTLRVRYFPALQLSLKSNFYNPIFDSDTGEIIGYSVKSSIDTVSESIDPQLTAELISVIEKIVREELTNHTVQNQKKVKELK